MPIQHLVSGNGAATGKRYFFDARRTLFPELAALSAVSLTLNTCRHIPTPRQSMFRSLSLPSFRFPFGATIFTALLILSQD